MIAIVETHDLVRLHWMKMVLEEADLHPFVFETNGPYAAMPIRLMVPGSEIELARRVIAEAEAGL